jgi:hypothetical protein
VRVAGQQGAFGDTETGVMRREIHSATIKDSAAHAGAGPLAFGSRQDALATLGAQDSPLCGEQELSDGPRPRLATLVNEAGCEARSPSTRLRAEPPSSGSLAKPASPAANNVSGPAPERQRGRPSREAASPE